jgi:hypothetical protein
VANEREPNSATSSTEDVTAKDHTSQKAPETPEPQSARKRAVTAKTTKRAPSKRGTARTPGKKTALKVSKSTPKSSSGSSSQAKFPRHPVRRALRIPEAILDQNAGHACTAAEAAQFLGGSNSGAFQLEVSSAKKYGFLESQGGKLLPTDRAKRALRPQSDTDERDALREAVLGAPDLSEVYEHYRGELLPDDKFFANALVETFGIPRDKIDEFREVFSESLEAADLIEQVGGRAKLVDVGIEEASQGKKSAVVDKRQPRRLISTGAGTCFVVQPFGPPFGSYYESVFVPAIENAGLRPIRADAEIFGAGKVMDQVWRGIRAAQVLVAELTTRNPNVYYELGLAHALGKPVVLISSDEGDVPFDLRHIRVIYYDKSDPFWGAKLIDKVSENVKSAMESPEEAIFKVEDDLP